MNQLTKFLVDGILNEGEQKTLAAYGGGFKPPTSGHFEVVKQALKDNPEIDEFIIYVGSGTRNGISQAESILIWEIYQTYLPMKVKIEPSKAPIGDVLRLGKNNPQDKVYFVIGAREGNEGDLEDIKNRTRAIGGKHPNMEVKVITTKNEGMSGTNARKAAKVSFEDFAKFLPTELSNDEKETVYNIVKPVVKESLNENASYSQDIDIKQRIMQLTQHMLDKGMNIEPLPSVELLDGDSVNAREFLGKTAYYDPNSATIVLYTEGRHPKDIVRSFSHEMIHHIQNLEGRLGNIITTNTQEDDDLNDIEAEANLKGTMTFRNWTDSLNEGKKPYKHKYGFDDKLGKDPFGISAYARELALGLEEEIDEGRKKKKDPKKGTGKKPKDSSRRLYTDEDPKDTIGIKFRTKEDIVDTLNKKSFKAKSHARQSQIINLIHQRVRAAYNNAKDPDTKSRLKRGLDYITKKKEASKKKTQRLKNQKNENVAPDHDGKAAPYGSGYKPVNENKTTHKVIAKGIVFEPKDIIINVGDTVEWENKEGYHNVNGKTSHPRNKNNPESFGNKVGSGWTYKFTFTKPGLYKYHCDPHLSADMVGTIQVKENVKEGDTYEKMAAKGKKAGSLKQGTVRKRLGIKKGDKIPLSLINKEIARLKKMDKDPDKKGAQLGDKNQKYYKALQLSKTLKTTTNVNEDAGMIKCSNCGWEWELSNGGDDPYLCHKCGHDNKPNLMEGRYDTITNKLSKIIFEAFKDMHDRGEDEGEISLTIGPNDEDIISNEFEFDLEATVEFGDDDQYGVDGGANVGFDDYGDEVTPLISVRFKIPKNPKWNIISFDIKDVVRHELEHLTQEGENLKSGKFIKDDQILRNLIDMKLLSKAEYFKLEKEVDAMLQGMYFKAKKSKTPFKKVLNDYLDIFVDQKSISKEEKDDVLNIWRSRRKALSLPPFE